MPMSPPRARRDRPPSGLAAARARTARPIRRSPRASAAGSRTRRRCGRPAGHHARHLQPRAARGDDRRCRPIRALRRARRARAAARVGGDDRGGVETSSIAARGSAGVRLAACSCWLARGAAARARRSACIGGWGAFTDAAPRRCFAIAQPVGRGGGGAGSPASRPGRARRRAQSAPHPSQPRARPRRRASRCRSASAASSWSRAAPTPGRRTRAPTRAIVAAMRVGPVDERRGAGRRTARRSPTPTRCAGAATRDRRGAAGVRAGAERAPLEKPRDPRYVPAMPTPLPPSMPIPGHIDPVPVPARRRAARRRADRPARPVEGRSAHGARDVAARAQAGEAARQAAVALDLQSRRHRLLADDRHRQDACSPGSPSAS